MQNKKVNEFVLLSVPLEDCIAAGICENCILQTYTENGKLIISTVSAEDFVCDGDCESCPCFDECDDAEVNDYE